MTRRYDVAIVGGGLIGASLACALRETGLRTALVEAVAFRSDAQPSYDEKMLSLAPASRRILEGIGVWPAIESHGVTPIEHIHISDRGHFGKTRLSAAELDVPAGTQSGETFRLRGKGMPHLRGRGHGDLYVQVQIVTPEELNREQREALERFAEAGGEDIEVNEGFFTKLRNSL